MSTSLAFDFGLKYIGVATGQSITRTASPLTSIRAVNGIPKWEDIDNIVNTWKPNDIIVGLPLNMDGTEQPMSQKARKFSQRLAHRYKPIKVHLEDERLTSWEAKNNINGKNSDLVSLNAKAAAIILQQWLEYN